MGIKTLHLTNAYHEHSGGIRTMYHALIEEAERSGSEIRLVVPAADDGADRVGRHAVIHRVRARRAPAFDRRYRTILPHQFLKAGTGRLWQILDAERPDVVEVCDKYSLCYFAGLVRVRRRLRREGPTLVGLSCERMDDNVAAHVCESPWTRAWTRQFLGRVYIGMFDAHVANSEYTAQELRDAMRAPHVRRVHVTPMGVRVPPAVEAGAREHARRLARSRLRVRADARLALYAGRLSPEKHVHALVTVARRLGWLRKAHLIVAGDGPLRVDLERACRRAGPDVARFVGHLDTRALGELIAACDVFVHPNPREPFGIGPLEALAAGVPLVAPRSGGILSFARDDNAWLTGATPEDLAAGVHAALASGAERERRGAAGRAMAARFAWPAAAARMLATYDAIHQARLTGRWIDPALSSTPVRTPA